LGDRHKVSENWQFLQFLFHEIGELCFAYACWRARRRCGTHLEPPRRQFGRSVAASVPPLLALDSLAARPQQPRPAALPSRRLFRLPRRLWGGG